MEVDAVRKAKEGNVDETGKIILENMQSMYRVAFSILRTEEETTGIGYYLLQEEWDSSNKFSIGDSVSFSLAESKESGVIEKIENSGKLLTIVFQEDISQTNIIEDSDYTYTFADEDFPSCKIASVYFLNGKFYRMPTYAFDFDEEDRTVDIEITADKEQYSPGDEVTLTVKTTNNGNAYADYLANTVDGGGGDGGEIRSDFADTACFETVYTDENGTATITFTLPDDVTTYRVTAQSANADLYLGENSIDITSTLDFYVQVTEPRNVKTTDDLVLTATSIAEKLYDVDFEFTITELDKTLTATETTNSVASVNFGKLEAGTYHAIIRGTYGEQTDAIEYEFTIVESAQEVKNKTTVIEHCLKI